MSSGKVHLSVVIPLMNEEASFNVLYKTLIPVLESITPSFELVFVDDGSSDRTFDLIEEYSRSDDRVRGVSLSRNFGHQIALLAGLQHASGEVVVTMDGDMQHPPEVIPELYARYNEGYDIVNTLRLDTADSTWLKKTTSKGFYKFINTMSNVKIESASADFRLMTRQAVDAFLTIGEKDRFTRGLVSWMGFRQFFVPYQAPARFAGESKYNLKKMFRFALDGITSFSAKPLRISFYLGLSFSIIGLLYALYAIGQYFNGTAVAGWTSILVSVLVIGGLQLLSIGVVGEYLARVFNEAKNRPHYLVRKYTGKLESIPNADTESKFHKTV